MNLVAGRASLDPGPWVFGEDILRKFTRGMTESSAWRTVVSAADAMPHGLKGFAMAAVSVGGLALVSHVAKRAMSRGDEQCSKSLIMESSSTKSAHRPYLKQDIPDVLGKAISEDLLGLNKEVRSSQCCTSLASISCANIQSRMCADARRMIARAHTQSHTSLGCHLVLKTKTSPRRGCN